MSDGPLPDLVVAADWSARPAGRWIARARRRDAAFVVDPPEPAGVVSVLERTIALGGRALVGFDFPIGLPHRYANRAAIDRFPEALPRFGHGPWRSFFDVTDGPTLHRPFYPPPSRVRGQYTRAALVAGLGLDRFDDLLRACDRPTATRPAAQPLFFTMGGKQVGRAAIAGWRDELQPHLDRVSLWPFDGRLDELLARPRATVVTEIYPAEAADRLGLRLGARHRRSKRRADDRRATLLEVRAAIEPWPVVIEEATGAWLETAAGGEDALDAFIGLLSMIAVAIGRWPAAVPRQPDHVRRVEGWILGLDARRVRAETALVS